MGRWRRPGGSWRARGCNSDRKDPIKAAGDSPERAPLSRQGPAWSRPDFSTGRSSSFRRVSATSGRAAGFVHRTHSAGAGAYAGGFDTQLYAPFDAPQTVWGEMPLTGGMACTM